MPFFPGFFVLFGKIALHFKTLIMEFLTIHFTLSIYSGIFCNKTPFYKSISIEDTWAAPACYPILLQLCYAYKQPNTGNHSKWSQPFKLWDIKLTVGDIRSRFPLSYSFIHWEYKITFEINWQLWKVHLTSWRQKYNGVIRYVAIWIFPFKLL